MTGARADGSPPGYGHLQPMLRLAATFRDAGDDVKAAIAPELASRIAAAGSTTVPAGGNFSA